MEGEGKEIDWRLFQGDMHYGKNNEWYNWKMGIQRKTYFGVETSTSVDEFVARGF